MARIENDAYYTPQWAVRGIIPKLNHSCLSGIVIEPSIGGGSILEAIDRGRAGRCGGMGMGGVIGFDIDTDACDAAKKRWPSVAVINDDFLASGPSAVANLVIGNPPFSKALEFVEWSIRKTVAGGEIAMLLRLAFLASQVRASFHRENPADIYVLPRRPSFTPDGKTDSSDYAWFVWRKGDRRLGQVQILDVEMGATK